MRTTDLDAARKREYEEALPDNAARKKELRELRQRTDAARKDEERLRAARDQAHRDRELAEAAHIPAPSDASWSLVERRRLEEKGADTAHAQSVATLDALDRELAVKIVSYEAAKLSRENYDRAAEHHVERVARKYVDLVLEVNGMRAFEEGYLADVAELAERAQQLGVIGPKPIPSYAADRAERTASAAVYECTRRMGIALADLITPQAPEYVGGGSPEMINAIADRVAGPLRK